MEAKKIKLILGLLLIAFGVGAQTVQIPHKEFALNFSTHKLELARGENGQLDIGILKSKSYRSNKVKMGIASSIPKGVSIAFDPANGNFDFTKATVSVASDATPGAYQLILNATLNANTKGSILKLIIKE
jgi:hypothetical protein